MLADLGDKAKGSQNAHKIKRAMGHEKQRSPEGRTRTQPQPFPNTPQLLREPNLAQPAVSFIAWNQQTPENALG